MMRLRDGVGFSVSFKTRQVLFGGGNASIGSEYDNTRRGIMKTIVIGVDPGKDGAVCVLYPNDDVYFWPMQFHDKELSLTFLRSGFEDYVYPACVFIERPPGLIRIKPKGKKSIVVDSTKLNLQAGQIYGLVVGLGLSCEWVRPQEWKSLILVGRSKEKDATISFAMDKFPAAPWNLTNKAKRSGQADALAIALYGRMRS